MATKRISALDLNRAVSQDHRHHLRQVADRAVSLQARDPQALILQTLQTDRVQTAAQAVAGHMAI